MPKPRRATPRRRSNPGQPEQSTGDTPWKLSRPVRGRRAAAPKESFTGTVWQDPIITPQAPMRIVASRVAFEPGARTAWHTHPLGQTLYVIAGVGRFQSKGGPIHEIKPGDVVWIPPGEKHWHGGVADHGHGPYSDAGSAGWKPRDLDGARHRRGIFRQRRIAAERSSSTSVRCAVRSMCPSTWCRARCRIPTSR